MPTVVLDSSEDRIVGLSIRPRTIDDGGIEIAFGVPKAMESLLILTTLVASFAVLAAASLRWGADSRECLPDDHRR